jgi:hypothetical protein
VIGGSPSHPVPSCHWIGLTKEYRIVIAIARCTNEKAGFRHRHRAGFDLFCDDDTSVDKNFTAKLFK